MCFNERPCAEKLDMRALKLEVGRRIEVFAAVLLTVVESLLSNLTFHEGPPNCNCQEIEAFEGETTSFSSREYLALTSTTESRAAIARISAQDTTHGHAFFSILALISSTTLNPPLELWIRTAVSHWWSWLCHPTLAVHHSPGHHHQNQIYLVKNT